MVMPNARNEVDSGNNYLRAPYIIYSVNITTVGTWYAWVRLYANTSNDNDIHFGFNNTYNPL